MSRKNYGSRSNRQEVVNMKLLYEMDSDNKVARILKGNYIVAKIYWYKDGLEILTDGKILQEDLSRKLSKPNETPMVV